MIYMINDVEQMNQLISEKKFFFSFKSLGFYVTFRIGIGRET